MKYSPGPWRHLDGLIVAQDGTQVARVVATNAKFGPTSVSEARGNKVLATRAPELLLALERVLLQPGPESAQQAQELLAQIEAEA